MAGQYCRQFNPGGAAAIVAENRASPAPRQRRANIAQRSARRRKARKSAKTGRIKRTGLMFRKLRLARAMMLRTDGNGAELSFRGRARVAAEHHYGAEVIVGKTKDGRTIKARMAERQLLGFSSADPDMIMDAATRHLTG